MRIEKIIENKKQFLDLLLLADEQENMILQKRLQNNACRDRRNADNFVVL